MEVPGSACVVTGASAGIGEATAWSLARAGARVVLAARRVDRLDRLATEIARRGGQAVPVRCDVTSLDDLEALRDRTVEAFGRCDVVVNNVGIPGGGPFAEVTLDQVERVIETNLLSVVRTTHVFLPGMLNQGSGHIVNVASLAGRFAMAGSAVYSATKHGVVAFSEALHWESEPRGVLVTAVNPGLVRTEGFPQGGARRSVMQPLDVAGLILRVIRRGIASEASIPRWLSAAQAFRLLTPPLYGPACDSWPDDGPDAEPWRSAQGQPGPEQFLAAVRWAFFAVRSGSLVGFPSRSRLTSCQRSAARS
jgi:short-subunit dehydrogenase